MTAFILSGRKKNETAFEEEAFTIPFNAIQMFQMLLPKVGRDRYVKD